MSEVVWWRHLECGTEGLYDLTRANHRAQRIPPELERTILSIRRRLQAHASPTTRYLNQARRNMSKRLTNPKSSILTGGF